MNEFLRLLANSVATMAQNGITRDQVLLMLSDASRLTPTNVSQIFSGEAVPSRTTMESFAALDGFANMIEIDAAATQSGVQFTMEAPAAPAAPVAPTAVAAPPVAAPPVAPAAPVAPVAPAPAAPVAPVVDPNAVDPNAVPPVAPVAPAAPVAPPAAPVAPVAPVAPAAPVAAPVPTQVHQPLDMAAQFALERQQISDEYARRATITNALSEFPNLVPQAINESWDDATIARELRIAKAEKQILTMSGANNGTNGGAGHGAGYGTAFNTNVGQSAELSQQENDDLVACAMALNCGVSAEELIDPNVRFTPEQQMEFGTRELRPMNEAIVSRALKTMKSFNFRDLCNYCNDESTFGGPASVDKAIYGIGGGPQMGNFSTIRFPKFLEDCIERAIVANYRKVAPKWNRIAAAMRVDNFKEHALFRVFGTGQWEPVKCADVITHGNLSAAEVGSIKVCTYAQMLSICHEHIIDGELGTIQSFAEMMAMEGRLAPEISLWDTMRKDLCSDDEFDFTNPDSLENMHELFCQKIAGGDPNDESRTCGTKIALDLEAAVLVINKCDEMKLRRLLNGDPALCGNSGIDNCETRHLLNVFQGMFEVCASNMFCAKSLAMMTGPNIAPAYRMAFLNGVQTPRIERLQPDNNKLGLELRGTITYGVAPTEAFLTCSTQDLAEWQAAQAP